MDERQVVNVLRREQIVLLTEFVEMQIDLSIHSREQRMLHLLSVQLEHQQILTFQLLVILKHGRVIDNIDERQVRRVVQADSLEVAIYPIPMHHDQFLDDVVL
jgi:hypothetical protein